MAKTMYSENELPMNPDEVQRKPYAVLCDLDGTLCINDQGRSPYDYKQARHDAVSPAVAETLLAFIDGNPYIDIVFVSAREEFGRGTVEEWLRQHLPEACCKNHAVKLHMRPNLEHKKDSLVKADIYWKEIYPYYEVLFVMDDRDQVVEMWRNLGLTCFQVAKGAF